MSVRPYVGITDFTSFEQVQAMLAVFNRHKKPGSQRLLHFGVMMSFKTLNDIETKWSKAFPAKEKIAEIFGSDEVMNCLHYADYDHDPNFWKNLTRAISFGGIGIHAIQLDMVWPDAGQIARALHASRKNIEVILQLNTKALDEIGNSPMLLVRKLHEYEGVATRVLLDKSMGKGLGMDAEALLRFVPLIKKYFPDLGVVVAGGLGPATMHLVEPIVGEFPLVSIDAQGKLRPSGNALDPVDWEMAEEYLRKSLRILK